MESSSLSDFGIGGGSDDDGDGTQSDSDENTDSERNLNYSADNDDDPPQRGDPNEKTPQREGTDPEGGEQESEVSTRMTVGSDAKQPDTEPDKNTENTHNNGHSEAIDTPHTNTQTPEDLTNKLTAEGTESFNEYWRNNTETITATDIETATKRPFGEFAGNELGQCQRRWMYEWTGAPVEEKLPYGIFETNTRIRERVIVDWLSDTVDAGTVTEPEEITVSISPTENTPATSETEQTATIPEPSGDRTTNGDSPYTVTVQSGPLIRNESDDVTIATLVKTTGNIERTTGIKYRHLLELNTLLHGLGIENGLVIYVDRHTLVNPRIYSTTYSSEAIDDVREWTTETAQFVVDEKLPPAEPPENWMCSYCPYEKRCGVNDSKYGGLSTVGFVAGLNAYSRQTIESHLETHPDAKLTPTLAIDYPDLADTHDVDNWYCLECEQSYEHTDSEFETFNYPNTMTPECPECGTHLHTEQYATAKTTPQKH